jgi:hypothetical protein
VDVGQKHGTVACRRDGTDSKWRSHKLAVDDCRSCVPFVAAHYGVKTRQALLHAIGINAQNMCVVGSNKDSVANCCAAGKIEFAFCYLGPFALRGSPAERMPTYNCEYSSLSIGRQTANRLIDKFLLDRVSGDAE